MINPGCFGGVQGNLSLHQRVEHAVILAPILSACLHGVADGVSVKEAVLRPSVYPPKFTKGISDSWRLSIFQNSVQILIFFITDFCELKNFGKKIFLEKKIFAYPVQQNRWRAYFQRFSRWRAYFQRFSSEDYRWRAYFQRGLINTPARTLAAKFLSEEKLAANHFPATR